MTDTSIAALHSIATVSTVLRDECLARIRQKPQTADQCASILGQSVLAVRPRFTELRNAGLIHDSGVRDLNVSGRRAIVWVAA